MFWDALSPRVRITCEDVGHDLQWVYGWDCFVCHRCGLTIQNPNRPRVKWLGHTAPHDAEEGPL